ncbi:MAG TPA: hypothetical protein VNU46_00370 [Gemmatimonadaceae bacterium]|jgi:hypothetical protein|nr:hypothetical protein [Gemmatimonadaceae bacterium]
MSPSQAIMATEALTLQLDTKAVEAYRTASDEVKRKMLALLSVWLPVFTDPRRTDLGRVMDDIGTAAQARGLTPELLDAILRDK